MPDTTEHYVTREELRLALERIQNQIERLQNNIDAKFNAVDAKFNAQRTLLLGIVLGVIAQILNTWVIHR